MEIDVFFLYRYMYEVWNTTKGVCYTADAEEI